MISAEAHLLTYQTYSDEKGLAFPNATAFEHITFTKQSNVSAAKGSSPIAQNNVNCLISNIQQVEKTKEIELFGCKDDQVLKDDHSAVKESNMYNVFGLDAALQEYFHSSPADVKQSQTTYLMSHCKEVVGKLPKADNLCKSKEQSNAHLVSAFARRINTKPEDFDARNQVAFLYRTQLHNTALPDMLYLT